MMVRVIETPLFDKLKHHYLASQIIFFGIAKTGGTNYTTILVEILSRKQF